MASAERVLKEALDVNHCSITDIQFANDCHGGSVMHVYLKLHKGHEHNCPICGKKCSWYDRKQMTDAVPYSKWRSLDLNGIKVYLYCRLGRIYCPEHGVHTAGVPWAFMGSRFTKVFDLTACFLGMRISRKAASEFMRCDWDTIGRCIGRARNFIEPEVKRRYENLRNIGVDETSYRKGHKYITVVVNHDTGEVVWCHEGHSIDTFSMFFEELTQEQRDSIKTVSGDGARWIDACIEKYCPHATRTIDGFHVVCWGMEALDKVRVDCWKQAVKEFKELEKSCGKLKTGRPKDDDKNAQKLRDAKQKASYVKGSGYTVGKNPENLTDKQRASLEVIANTSPILFRAYKLKELLRGAFKLENVEDVKAVLKDFFWKATHSRISYFKELAYKIRRHEEHILNTIKTGLSNARVESVNNKIKLFIRKAYGFRNIQNMYDIIMLGCSNLEISLPNWGNKSLKLA